MVRLGYVASKLALAFSLPVSRVCVPSMPNRPAGPPNICTPPAWWTSPAQCRALKTAFQDPYPATVQLGGTDPNELHDPKADLDA